MNHWLTTHWPRLEDQPDNAPWGVWLQDGYKHVGDDLVPGDHVLIFETQNAPNEVKGNSTGRTRTVKHRTGRRGIVAIVEVTSGLRKSNKKPERFADGATRWWRWMAETRVVLDGGFVPWQQVNRVLGYEPDYNMRGFGGGSGLKKISQEQYDQLAELFDPTRKNSPMRFKEKYVVDEQGKRVAIILDMVDYEKLLEELEELESLRAYDAAKSSGDEAIRFEQAVNEIERGH